MFPFIEYLAAVNDDRGFEKAYHGNYPPELEMKC